MKKKASKNEWMSDCLAPRSNQYTSTDPITSTTAVRSKTRRSLLTSRRCRSSHVPNRLSSSRSIPRACYEDYDPRRIADPNMVTTTTPYVVWVSFYGSDMRAAACASVPECTLSTRHVRASRALAVEDRVRHTDASRAVSEGEEVVDAVPAHD